MGKKWGSPLRRAPRFQVHPLCQKDPDKEAEAVVLRAEQGDPGALGEILSRLSRYLVGQALLPREYALFCSEAFRRFAESKTMAEAVPAFKEHALSELERAYEEDEASGVVLPGGNLRLKIQLGLGPRLSSTWIRRIGASFSQSFQLRETARRLEDPPRAKIARSPELAHPLDQNRIDLDSRRLAGRAKNGHLEALCQMLLSLAAHLRGEAKMPREYTFFCSDALKDFTDSDPMYEAGETFRRRGKLEIEGASNRYGDALPDLRKIERAFCRAFHISKPQGSQIPNHPTLCPTSAWQAHLLRYFGESLPRAIEIVCSHYTDTSPRQVETWIRERGFRKPVIGTIAGNDYLRCQWRMGLRVLRELIHGATEEEAYETVAHEVVRDLVRLSEATVFLKPETVAKAFLISWLCRYDSWWDRIWTYMEARFQRPTSRRYQPS